jgi:Ty3 transposon capsid-like protein/Zinc knuckle
MTTEAVLSHDAALAQLELQQETIERQSRELEALRQQLQELQQAQLHHGAPLAGLRPGDPTPVQNTPYSSSATGQTLPAQTFGANFTQSAPILTPTGQGPAPLISPSIQATTSLLKPLKPQKFKGGRGVTTWLFQLEQYFLVLGTQLDTQKIAFAGSMLEESAASWWMAMHIAAQNGMGLLPHTWEHFKQCIKQRFQPIEESEMARQRLRKLTHTGSIRRYILEFNELVLQIPSMDEGTKMDNFIFGLKPDVRRWIRQQRPHTLLDAITLAEEFDIATQQDLAADRALAKKGAKFFQKGTNRHQYDDGHVPMEIGSALVSPHPNSKVKKPCQASSSTTTSTGSTKVTRQRPGFIPICYKCGNPGHMKMDCPTAKSKPKPRVAAVIHDDVAQSFDEEIND